MNRNEFEHVIRAAADVSGEDEIVVIGSQAILGTVPEPPGVLLVSREADVFPRQHPERADDIDGAIGDGSQFHVTYGYYAHGVGPETAVAPAGWMDRLVPVLIARRAGTRGHITAWCMEVHDLVLSKLAAGRERDVEYAIAAVREGVVVAAELRRRAEKMPLSHRESVQRLVKVVITRA